MSEKSKNQGVDLSERLKDALGERYISIINEFQKRGLTFKGAELDAFEVKLKFYSDYNDISFVMSKLLIDKFNYIKIRSSLCDAGGTPLTCLELTVTMPRQI